MFPLLLQLVLQGNGVRTAGMIVPASMELSAILLLENVLVHQDGMVIFLQFSTFLFSISCITFCPRPHFFAAVDKGLLFGLNFRNFISPRPDVKMQFSFYMGCAIQLYCKILAR